MNLERLTELLETMPASKPIRIDTGPYPRSFTSWRGSYDELTLAHAPGDTPITVGELHLLASAADGATFTGYKGGDYTMGSRTPVWADDYGDYGCRGILELVENADEVIIVTADLSDYR